MSYAKKLKYPAEVFVQSINTMPEKEQVQYYLRFMVKYLLQTKESQVYKLTPYLVREVIHEFENRGATITETVFNDLCEAVRDFPMYNPTSIKHEVFFDAVVQGLDYAQTGGGCDFIVRNFKNGMTAVLSCEGSNDASQSPGHLEEPSRITLYQDEEWLRGIWIEGFNACKGIDIMCNMGEADA